MSDGLTVAIRNVRRCGCVRGRADIQNPFLEFPTRETTLPVVSTPSFAPVFEPCLATRLGHSVTKFVGDDTR